jgi:CBS-domain-containing membrane protein
VLAALGAAAFILSLGALDPLSRGALSLPVLLPPFGASTVIVFFAPDSPAGRPWNVVVGHLGSALVAFAVMALGAGLGTPSQAAAAVAGASVWMVLTRSVHPPGGATALLTTLAGRSLDSAWDLAPLLAGCLTLVAVRGLLDRVIGWVVTRRRSAG